MEKIGVKIKLLSPKAKVPEYKSEGAAAFDFYSTENKVINPGETILVGTGIAISFPKGYALQLWDRSGLGAKGICRFAGVIDSDYRGEIKAVLHNTTKETFKIEEGDRIIQGKIIPILQAQFEQVNELDDTIRGEGGFHSTGKK